MFRILFGSHLNEFAGRDKQTLVSFQFQFGMFVCILQLLYLIAHLVETLHEVAYTVEQGIGQSVHLFLILFLTLLCPSDL